MAAELVVLGAGSILPRAGYGCAGYALRPEPRGPVTLLDCGPGSVRALGAAGIAVEDVRRVVVSHFHTDHVLDLFALSFARRNPRFADAAELELVGPRGLAAMVEAAPRALGRWVSDPRARVTEVELDARGFGALERDGLALRCAATGHTPEALAWRVEIPGGPSLAYSGDTGEEPRVAELARGAGLFVCECSFPDEAPVPHHLTPSSAARLASGAERLLLTHFYPETDPERARAVAEGVRGGPVEVARDGLRVALGRAGGAEADG